MTVNFIVYPKTDFLSYLWFSVDLKETLCIFIYVQQHGQIGIWGNQQLIIFSPNVTLRIFIHYIVYDPNLLALKPTFTNSWLLQIFSVRSLKCTLSV